jgi:hypothetical protein
MRAQIGSTSHARPSVVATNTDESLASGSVGNYGYLSQNAVDYGDGPDSIWERDMIVGSVTQEGYYPYAEPNTTGLEDDKVSLTPGESIAPTAAYAMAEMYQHLAAPCPVQFSHLDTSTNVRTFDHQSRAEQPYVPGGNYRPAPPLQDSLTYAHPQNTLPGYMDPTVSWASGTEGNPPPFSINKHGSGLQPSCQSRPAQTFAFHASVCDPQPSLPIVPTVPSNDSPVLVPGKSPTTSVAPSALWLAHLHPAAGASHTAREYKGRRRPTKEERLKRARDAAAEARATVDEALKRGDFADTFDVPGQPPIEDRINALIDAFVIADTQPSSGRNFEKRRDKESQRQTFTRGVINLVKSLSRVKGSGTQIVLSHSSGIVGTEAEGAWAR